MSAGDKRRPPNAGSRELFAQLQKVTKTLIKRGIGSRKEGAMFRKQEYDSRVKRASVAGFALVGCVFLAAAARAQINAAPPSVTSQGFGGHPVSGVSPSVTSLGPRGYTLGANPAFPNSRVIVGAKPNVPSDGHHHHDGPYLGGAFVTPYYGYYDNGNGSADDTANDTENDEYKGGPTIFDRRGPGYAAPPPAEDYSDRQPAPTTASAPEPSPATPQPETVLVFKDGHQLEIENYAIVGSTLYDLTEGHRRRIGLSELDLVSTAKRNDDRGLDFRVPSSSQ